ncbi:DciA family protein [Wenzhouxiangella sp. EGI_FJ10409]|uniref:DciA family protein n=1 Tax=Wenzhouxiangella sp. EGI_FJ10409 TaxID=3243767 RepID=UPI0035E2ECFC
MAASRHRSERPITEISSKHDGLGRLLATARALDQLDASLRQVLPGSMREHIGLACIEGKTLVLAATSPAWASRARLMADDLLREANRQLDERLEGTRVIVVPGIR